MVALVPAKSLAGFRVWPFPRPRPRRRDRLSDRAVSHQLRTTTSGEERRFRITATTAGRERHHAKPATIVRRANQSGPPDFQRWRCGALRGTAEQSATTDRGGGLARV